MYSFIIIWNVNSKWLKHNQGNNIFKIFSNNGSSLNYSLPLVCLMYSTHHVSVFFLFFFFFYIVSFFDIYFGVFNKRYHKYFQRQISTHPFQLSAKWCSIFNLWKWICVRVWKVFVYLCIILDLNPLNSFVIMFQCYITLYIYKHWVQDL